MPDIQWLSEPAAIDRDALAPQGLPCAACGTPVESLDKFCPACGQPNPSYARPGAPVLAEVVETAESGLATLPERVQKHFHCENCGSDVATDPDQRSYVCPFCDSTYVVEVAPQLTGRQQPEFVIGFAITPQQAQEKFQAWLRQRAWYRPGDLHTASVADKLKGIYLPLWSFSMLAESRWNANIGEYWYRTETYTTTDSKGRTTTHTRRVQETEWWPLAGNHHRYYSGYLVSGSRGLPQKDAERIKPFNLPALKRYEPYFLAGWLCEEYSIGRDEALQLSQQEFQRQEHVNIGAFLPGDTHRDLAAQTEFSHINSDLCLMPVYILSYHYQGKLYRFLLNGQTGKYDGDKPIAWVRIWIAVGIIVFFILIIGLLIALFAQPN